jgi:hypothetical protein
MTLQYSVTLRNNRLDQVEATIAAAPVMELRSGTPPANCAAASTGTVLCTLTLPSDWMAAASGGTKAKLGTWQDLNADAAGTFGHFRIWDSTITTCHMQGTVGISAADMIVDSATVSLGQAFLVTSFTLTAGNA